MAIESAEATAEAFCDWYCRGSGSDPWVANAITKLAAIIEADRAAVRAQVLRECEAIAWAQVGVASPRGASIALRIRNAIRALPGFPPGDDDAE